jgi:hypothetical protein
MNTLPIADHALLSDRHSAALLTTAGSIDWLCLTLRALWRLLGEHPAEPPAHGIEYPVGRGLDRHLLLAGFDVHGADDPSAEALGS